MVRCDADPFLCDNSGKSAFDMTKEPQILIALAGKPKTEKPENICGDTLSERDCESVLNDDYELKKLVQDFSKITTQPTTAVTSLKACKSDLFPIYDWLTQQGLEDYYEMIKSQGFFSVEDLLTSPEGLKSRILPNIHKQGHHDRLIFRLTEEGYKKDAKIFHKKSKSSFLRCCGITSSNNQGLFYTPDLKKWLSDIHMEVYFKNFIDAGYDDIDALIVMADSHLGLNKEKLAKIGIVNDKHVLKVLRKLDKDNANIYSRNSVGRISFDEPKTVACESCIIT
jgi:hypothetical protein